jgi:hypothetical protein
MQQKDEPILARPGRSPTYLVGVTGLLYLGVGGVIAYAYCVGRNAAFGPEVFWERVPANALWLVPGLALLASVGFVRRHNWAALVSAAIFGASAVVAFALLVRSMLAIRAVPLNASMFVALLAVWLCVLWAGLSRLRRQWAWLRAAALPPGHGFPVQFRR